MSYFIAILGTTTYKEPNKDSEVALSELATTDPMTDEDWITIEIKGMSPQYEFIEEPDTATGGISLHNFAQHALFNIPLAPLGFPEDMAHYKRIMKALNYPHIYLYRGTYTFSELDDPWDIHSDNKCLKISVISSYSDDYDNAIKEITLAVKKEMPELYE
jgi:hypothetical protein